MHKEQMTKEIYKPCSRGCATSAQPRFHDSVTGQYNHVCSIEFRCVFRKQYVSQGKIRDQDTVVAQLCGGGNAMFDRPLTPAENEDLRTVMWLPKTRVHSYLAFGFSIHDRIYPGWCPLNFPYKAR